MRGKHVEWVPCSPVVIDKMLDMARVDADDCVIDPGSGDGRIVIRAAKAGAMAVGIEANPGLAVLSRQNAEKEGVSDRASFCVGDFFEADLSKATVVTLFLRRDLNLKLRARLLDLKPGTRIVSNIFDMGDWEADKIVKVEDENYYFRNHIVRLWIVPVGIDGLWQLPQGELAITQKFQRIGGALTADGNSIPIEGSITGNRIDFTADNRKYTGHVTGDRMNLEERKTT
jgi:precorrin-6B methylase 2